MAFRSKVTATGRYRLGPGTLYDNLRTLLDRGVVEEPSPRASVDDHDLASASRESRESCLNFMNSTYGSIPPDVVFRLRLARPRSFAPDRRLSGIPAFHRQMDALRHSGPSH